jgi:hypothetical protein
MRRVVVRPAVLVGAITAASALTATGFIADAAVKPTAITASCQFVKLSANVRLATGWTRPTACLLISSNGKRLWTLSGVWKEKTVLDPGPVLVGSFNPVHAHTGRLGGSTILPVTGKANTTGVYAVITPDGEIWLNGPPAPTGVPLAVTGTIPAGVPAYAPQPTARVAHG